MARRAELREARQPVAPTTSPMLVLDPAVCDGVGICAHLAPDLVTVDSWGYPIVSSEPLERGSERRQAEAAVRACPRKALHLRS
jgi:ferredoxin